MESCHRQGSILPRRLRLPKLAALVTLAFSAEAASARASDVGAAGLEASFCSSGLPGAADQEDVASLLQLRPSSQAVPADRSACAALEEVSHAELALLAGDIHHDISLTSEAFAALGWNRGPRMRATGFHYKSYEYDFAGVYTKGCRGEVCDHCAFVFSATDDFTDVLQGYNNTYESFCGMPEVQAGYIWQIRAYYSSANWSSVREALSPSRCCRTHATGISMGGVLASMFAYCSNLVTPPTALSQMPAKTSWFKDSPIDDKAYFAGFPRDFNLVTFGAPRSAMTPLYNGVAGKCFQGTRYAIADSSAKYPSYQCTDDGLVLMLGTMWDMWLIIPATILEGELKTIRGLRRNGASFEELKARIEDVTLQNWDHVQMMSFMVAGQAPLPWVPKARRSWRNFTKHCKEYFEFGFDLVPGLSKDPLVHALVPFEPLPHPKAKDSAVLRTPPAEACSTYANSDRPHYCPLQMFGGLLGKLLRARDATTAGYPNHSICCYILALGGLPGFAGERSCGEAYYGDAREECEEVTWR